VEGNRNFANKVWNAGRLVLSAIEKTRGLPPSSVEPTLADRWIVGRQKSLANEVDRLFQAHQYGEAGRQIYEFFWNEFADWYLEISKLQMETGGARAASTARILASVLDTCLRMLHPFTPFVTEEVWQYLKKACQGESGLPSIQGEWEEALIIAVWPALPAPSSDEAEAMAQFAVIQELVTAIRNLRSESGVEPRLRIPACFISTAWLPVLQSQRETLAVLARLDPAGLEILPSPQPARPGALALVVRDIEVYLPMEGMVDVKAERARLQAELRAVEAQLQRLEALLGGPFAERAPQDVVAKEREKQGGLQSTADRLRQQLLQLG
jgi:valyl-tRNA synthetase